MAKLCVAYILCPLIDQRSLLGVSEDSEGGHVIITLGKNIVIRYKLQDQKQISSWSSKDKFSSHVVFDKSTQTYVAVINENQLRVWSETDHQLDKIKKLKFEQAIHCIVAQPDEDPPVVVFRNGTVAPLTEALTDRKVRTSEPAQDNAIQQDCQLITHRGSKYVTFLSVASTTETWFHAVSVDQSEESVRVCVSRPEMTLRGHTVLQDEDACFLYTIWSDGQLFSMRLFTDSPPTSPGTLIQTVSGVSAKHTVAMTPLSPHHLAMYGADASEEGATLLIYNTQFRLVQARQKSKLFGIAPRLWRIGANLFVASGNFLSVTPFRLDVARLAALVGSHGPVEGRVAHAVWGERREQPKPIVAPGTIDRTLRRLAKRGWSQTAIVQEILPELLEKKDLVAILWCLENMNDIPETALVRILEFCLDETNATFDETEPDRREPGAKLSPGKKRFVDAVLKVPFGDVSLLPPLRLLSLSHSLSLLDHLAEKLSESADARTMEWIGLVLDSHYQECLLTKDPRVLAALKDVRAVIDAELAHVDELKGLAPLLHRLSLNKSIMRNSQLGTKEYSIEVLRLY